MLLTVNKIKIKKNNFLSYSISAMMSRRNGNSEKFKSRRNGSRRNGTNHRQNGSRRNGSRRNGSDSYEQGQGAQDIEPPHDKTSKMACAPSEDSNQADLSLRWAHIHFVGFVTRLERAAVVRAIIGLERISGLYPSLEMIDPRCLNFSTASSL